jgi:hypothetical protein
LGAKVNTSKLVCLDKTINTDRKLRLMAHACEFETSLGYKVREGGGEEEEEKGEKEQEKEKRGRGGGGRKETAIMKFEETPNTWKPKDTFPNN